MPLPVFYVSTIISPSFPIRLPGRCACVVLCGESHIAVAFTAFPPAPSRQVSAFSTNPCRRRKFIFLADRNAIACNIHSIKISVRNTFRSISHGEYFCKHNLSEMHRDSDLARNLHATLRVAPLYHAPIQVMIMAFVKSMRKAPTRETMSHAFGACPYFSPIACMLARPFAVAPIANPMAPTPSIIAS